MKSFLAPSSQRSREMSFQARNQSYKPRVNNSTSPENHFQSPEFKISFADIGGSRNPTQTVSNPMAKMTPQYLTHTQLGIPKKPRKSHSSLSLAIFPNVKSATPLHQKDPQANRFLNDSELESQMDDFAIGSNDSASDQSGAKSETETLSEDRYKSLASDPEATLLEKMENFYNQNFNAFEVGSSDNVTSERVWNIQIDKKYDFLYVVQARIHQLQGQRRATSQMGGGSSPPFIHFNVAKSQPKQTLLSGSELADHRRKNNSALKDDQSKQSYYYQNCTIEVELVLQIWSLDDRIFLDKDHRQRPISSLQILKKTQYFEKQMTTYDHQMACYNMLKDHAQILQQGDRLYLFTANREILVFDVPHRTTRVRRLAKQVQDQDDSMQAFQFVSHLKDIGKKTEHVDSLIRISYIHNETIKDNDESQKSGTPSRPVFSMEATIKKQKIRLETIAFSQLEKPSQKQLRVKEQLVSFKDDSIFKYFMDDQKRRQSSIFVQRIADSPTYIVLFPTGFLVQISSSLLSIQSRLQLNLKKDETIVDVCYCESTRNHCLWILDEQLQVWKCETELNSNSCNWTFSKSAVLYNIYYKRFLKPAMTFDDFFLTSKLSHINCFKQIGLSDSRTHSFLFAFNSTCSKCVVVKQPSLRHSQLQQEEFSDHVSDALSKSSSPYRRPSAARQRNDELPQRIQIMVVTKKQNIILNQITEKVGTMTTLRKEMFHKMQNLALDFKHRILSDLKDDAQDRGDQQPVNLDPNDLMNYFRKNNEIVELLYLGKVPKNVRLHESNLDQIANSNKQLLRAFLIRRTRSLEIMLTNGLTHHSQFVVDSNTEYPNVISKVKLGAKATRIIVTYSNSSHGNQSFIKVFHRSSDQMVFELLETFNTTLRSNKNLFFSMSGEIIELSVEFSTKTKDFKKAKQAMLVIEEGSSFKVRIPRVCLLADLLPFDNEFSDFTTSEDNRLILCSKVIIQLTEGFEEVKDMGVVILKKNYSSVYYRYCSLLEPSERRLIQHELEVSPQNIVRFDRETTPVSPPDKKNILYLLNCVDEATGETSVLKLESTDLYKVTEIYLSKFRLIHMALHEKVKAPKLANPTEVLNITESRKDSSLASLLVDSSLCDEPKMPKMNLQHPMKRALTTVKKEGQNNRMVYISLLSQTKHRIHIEIIVDTQTPEKESFKRELKRALTRSDTEKSLQEGDKSSFFKRSLTIMQSLNDESRLKQLENFSLKCELQCILALSTKAELAVNSEVGWITADNFIVTVNNNLFLVNLHQPRMPRIKNIKYSVQQITSDLFCSLVQSRPLKLKVENSPEQQQASLGALFDEVARQNQLNNQQLVNAQQCLLRMEVASLRRFMRLCTLKSSTSDLNRALVFFTPCEELHGSNIFSKLSNNYGVIQPYLELIDSDFISLMNKRVRNVSLFVNARSSNLDEDIDNNRQKGLQTSIQRLVPDLQEKKQGQIHMYQADILGKNAIDYAFEKNAIFCIKAFVETLLILPEDIQFKNCFDKALLHMIKRGMDVKGLVNSQLFYAQIWTDHTHFSASKVPLMVGYNGDLEDLQFENSHAVFEEPIKNKRSELFEMQFNYILMAEIEGSSKLEVSRVLKNCTDIELFEQEAIQKIIDFKWEVHTRHFFLKKFLIYLAFMITYYIDLDSSLSTDADGHRIKDTQFIVCKSISGLIMSYFLTYEINQVILEGQEYFWESWNYFELIGITLFFWAASLDAWNDSVSDLTRILFSLSVMFSLIKVVYLIRIFRQLNFLVTMFITVVNEIFYFIILFSLFTLTFAQSFSMIGVDFETYGRTPHIISSLASVLRLSMGDFSIIKPEEGFDITDDLGEPVHSRQVMLFTFVIFLVTIFYMFMIFMNFIIAVIGESYSKVIQNKEAFDYQQRAAMIYEREVHFKDYEFLHPELFPKILVIKQVKRNSFKAAAPGSSSNLGMVKQYIQRQIHICVEAVSQRAKEQQLHLTNSVRVLENCFSQTGRDIDQLFCEIKKLSLHHLLENDLKMRTTRPTEEQVQESSSSQSDDTKLHHLNAKRKSVVLEKKKSSKQVIPNRPASRPPPKKLKEPKKRVGSAIDRPQRKSINRRKISSAHPQNAQPNAETPAELLPRVLTVNGGNAPDLMLFHQLPKVPSIQSRMSSPQPMDAPQTPKPPQPIMSQESEQRITNIENDVRELRSMMVNLIEMQKGSTMFIQNAFSSVMVPQAKLEQIELQLTAMREKHDKDMAGLKSLIQKQRPKSPPKKSIIDKLNFYFEDYKLPDRDRPEIKLSPLSDGGLARSNYSSPHLTSHLTSPKPRERVFSDSPLRRQNCIVNPWNKAKNGNRPEKTSNFGKQDILDRLAEMNGRLQTSTLFTLPKQRPDSQKIKSKSSRIHVKKPKR